MEGSKMTDQNPQENLTSPSWQPSTRLAVAIFGALFGILLLYLLRSLAVPVILAFLFAYMLYPLTRWAREKTRLPKGLIAFLALLLSAVLILSVTTGLGVAFSQRVVDLALYLSSIVEQLPAAIESLADQTIVIWRFEIDLREMNISPLLTNLASSLSPLLTRAGSLIGSFAVAAVSGATTFLLMIVMSFYFLVDFEKLRPALNNIIPGLRLPCRGWSNRWLHGVGSHVWSYHHRGICSSYCALPASEPLGLDAFSVHSIGYWDILFNPTG
jgi:predicted PurR-regulated permease PerM